MNWILFDSSIKVKLIDGLEENRQKFIRFCHEYLLSSPQALAFIFQRGFTLTTIKKFKLGWHSEQKWFKRPSWGIADPEDKKLWLPKGIIVPVFHQKAQVPIKIKVRRSDWHEKDNWRISHRDKSMLAKGDKTS